MTGVAAAEQATRPVQVDDSLVEQEFGIVKPQCLTFGAHDITTFGAQGTVAADRCYASG